MSDYQTYVLRLPVNLGRRARDLVDALPAYRDLNELMVVALENQLLIEESPTHDLEVLKTMTHLVDADTPDAYSDEVAELLKPPVGASVNHVQAPPVGSGASLFVLTNRLSPVALATRVLVNLVERDGPPTVDDFLTRAGRCARVIGLRLKEEDSRAGVAAAQRRSVGWPVGDDIDKTLDRFVWAFLVHEANDPDRGAMAELGLAAVLDDEVHPTSLGIELSQAPSPLLGETEGWTLGTEQQQVLRRCVVAMRGEVAEIAVVLSALRVDRGVPQRRLDAAMRQTHSDWTENQVVSQRAAMLGRLRELGIVKLSGRGPSAMVNLSDEANEFCAEVVALAQEGAA